MTEPIKQWLGGDAGGGVTDDWNAMLYLGGRSGAYNIYANHFTFTNGLLSSYENNGGEVVPDTNLVTDAVASAVARYL